jgi:hypothetical protein
VKSIGEMQARAALAEARRGEIYLAERVAELEKALEEERNRAVENGRLAQENFDRKVELEKSLREIAEADAKTPVLTLNRIAARALSGETPE